MVSQDHLDSQDLLASLVQRVRNFSLHGLSVHAVLRFMAKMNGQCSRSVGRSPVTGSEVPP